MGSARPSCAVRWRGLPVLLRHLGGESSFALVVVFSVAGVYHPRTVAVTNPLSGLRTVSVEYQGRNTPTLPRQQAVLALQ